MESLIYNSSLITCGKFGLPYLGTTAAATRAVLLIPASVCSIFCVQWCGCQCLGFLKCAQMFMHAIAQRGVQTP